jgi:hypothetical protein
MKDNELEEIIQKCLDSPGYVVFVGALSDKRDEKGNNLIDFKYKRYQFSYEDTSRAIKEFQSALKDDIGID